MADEEVEGRPAYTMATAGGEVEGTVCSYASHSSTFYRPKYQNENDPLSVN